MKYNEEASLSSEIKSNIRMIIRTFKLIGQRVALILHLLA
jgi:hypothetical protein